MLDEEVATTTAQVVHSPQPRTSHALLTLLPCVHCKKAAVSVMQPDARAGLVP